MRKLPIIFVFVLVAIVCVFWWGGRKPKRPSTVSSRGIFIERGSVPFKLSTDGDWVDCWQEKSDDIYCKVVDQGGNVLFQDRFLPYAGKISSGMSVVIDESKARSFSLGLSCTHAIVPLIQLESGQVLLPAKCFEEAKSNLAKWYRPD